MAGWENTSLKVEGTGGCMPTWPQPGYLTTGEGLILKWSHIATLDNCSMNDKD